MIVNKNSNQSQALKLVYLHYVLLIFTVSLLMRANKCAICLFIFMFC